MPLIRLLLNKNFGRIWKDLIVATFPLGSEKSHERYGQHNRPLSRILKAGLPVYEAGWLRINFVTNNCCFPSQNYPTVLYNGHTSVFL